MTRLAETESTLVPEGHKLTLYRMDPRSLIVSTEAVAWLAHLGSSSDEAEEELDTTLAGVAALMHGGRPRILMPSSDIASLVEARQSLAVWLVAYHGFKS